MPGLDGLRALAVVAVLLYHAGLASVPGGFLGVEVFFVISGYLITALLVAEWRRRGRIDLAAFWMRRARRLLPALYLVVLATLAYAVVFLPGEVAGLRGDALSAFGYVTNWYLIFGNESYFEAMGRPSLLRHLWSLAVEEQFYLLWPPVVAAGISLGARRWRLRRLMFASLAVAGASALLMAALYAPEIDPSRIYYGTDTRATGLLFGAALAFVWRPGERTSREACARLSRRGSRPAARFRRRWGWLRPALLDAAGLAALGGLAAFCLRLDEFQPLLYTGGFAAVGLTTAALVAVVAHPHSKVGTVLLGWRPLRWVGERSYGIYLWHWPVFMVTRPGLDVPLDGAKLLALRLAVTVLLAHLSYRYVEQPVRHGALGRAWRTLGRADAPGRRDLGLRWAATAAPVVALCVVVGVAVWRAEPPAPPAYLATQEIHTATEPAPAGEDPSQNAPPPEAKSPRSAEAPPSPEKEPAKGQERPETAASDAAGKQEPRDAQAEQGTGEKAKADGAAPVAAGPVSAIGDSVMLGSAGPLQKEVDVSVMDAEVGMQVSYAIEVLRSRGAAGQLGDTVVVHLGNNGVFTRGQFEEMMRVLENVDRVVFVNVRVARAWETPNNRVIAAGVARHPNAELVDWYSASAGRPELFVSDGVHLQPPGQRLYAAMIRERIESG
ncbi:MAG: O-antigen acetylase [uncultured Rubrobacteraceae bacterium]|uniref:O-antigen acetylase n=1 Tax=uncultured Rubrobacteraceae bacterium TaxID=349277 RepID=A0A6J4RVL8_9ACTN|nr:MAG: O-antigen acetylase [uncultured Rubrobacteraceae bacterium]